MTRLCAKETVLSNETWDKNMFYQPEVGSQESYYSARQLVIACSKCAVLYTCLCKCKTKWVHFRYIFSFELKPIVGKVSTVLMTISFK